MTREEFATLPVQLALGLVFDMARARLEPMDRPAVPRPPLYDGRLSRGNKGFTYMSEMDLRSLEWWHGKKQESADAGGDYADKDAKTAATLATWIAWRRLFPYEVWSGKRGDERVTAAPPSPSPAMHQWEPRGGGKQSSGTRQGNRQEQAPEDDENNGYGF